MIRARRHLSIKSATQLSILLRYIDVVFTCEIISYVYSWNVVQLLESQENRCISFVIATNIHGGGYIASLLLFAISSRHSMQHGDIRC